MMNPSFTVIGKTPFERQKLEFQAKHGVSPQDPKKMRHTHEKKGARCAACDMSRNLNEQQKQALMAATDERVTNAALDSNFVMRLRALLPVADEVNKLYDLVLREMKRKNPAFSDTDLDILCGQLLTDDLKDTIQFVRDLSRETNRLKLTCARMRAKLEKKGTK